MGSGKILARTMPAGTMKVSRDATTNDSDKTLTVGARKLIRPLAIVAQITATATVGNRQLAVAITDGTNQVWTTSYTSAIIANATGQFRITFDTMAVLNNNQSLMFGTLNYANQQTNESAPDMYLPAGYVIRVWDVNTVDAAADDMVFVVFYEELDV